MVQVLPRYRRRGPASPVAVIISSLIAMLVAATGGRAEIAVALSAPTYVRTIGTAGEADMYPSGVDVDASGNVVVADTGNDRVEFYARGATSPTWSVGVRGAPVGGAADSFQNPRDVAVDANYVYVADTDDNVVQVLNKSTGVFVKKIAYKFSTPLGVSVGTDGAGHERVLVSNGGSGTVEVFDAALNHVLTVQPLTSNAGTRDAATDSKGNIYAADYRGNRIVKYSPTGTYLAQWGGSGAPTCQQVPRPYGVDVDDANHVYVASSNLEQIKEFSTTGTRSEERRVGKECRSRWSPYH
jgi:Uncharacterized conserved protein